MSKDKETTMNIDIEFKDGVGIVEDSSFEKSLPDDLEMDVFQKVDDHRDAYTAEVATRILDEIEAGDGAGEFTATGVYLGGNTRLDLSAGREQHLTMAVDTVRGECVDAVMQRAEDIYRETTSGD